MKRKCLSCATCAKHIRVDLGGVFWEEDTHKCSRDNSEVSYDDVCDNYVSGEARIIHYSNDTEWVN